MDLSNSADLTMFEESQELRPLSRSSSMGFCHSEPDTDFEDLGLPDETNFTLRLDTLRSKLLGEEFDEIEDGLDFPDDLANYGNNSFITEKSRACAIERQLPQSHGDTPELGLKQHQNILLLKDSGNSAPASTKSRNLNTISLADFQNSITNGPKPTQTLPVVNFNNFGDELIVSGNHWDMNTTEVQKNISTSSSATLHSRRSTKMSALDAKSNDADDLDNISDFDVDAETDISNRVLYSTAIAEKLANLKESENDDLLVEDNPIFAPKSTPNPKQMSVRVNATKSRNTISIFQPVSLRNPQPVKASNSNFSKPPLKSSRISAEHLPRSSPPFKEKVKGVVTSRKPTYKVVFGRTILIEQPKSKSKKAQTKPTLIRNLSNYDQPKVIGKMTYDPISMKWNGNESELDEFEKKVSQKAAKPKLIQQERSALPEKIGEMVFDPVALVWRGNEDNVDAHIFDDIDELATAAKPIYEYNLGKLLTDLFHKCEVNHKLLMGSWFSPVLSKTRIPRDSSKSFLYEIRAVKL